jgi:hypothetical protein
MSPSKRAGISSYRQGEGDNGTITLSNLTPDEVDKFRGLFAGMEWMTVEDGRFSFQSTVPPMPGPADDPEMMPFWRRPREGEAVVQEMLFDRTVNLEHYSPSIIIQHLCGFNYTPDWYREQVGLLESWGFRCLRSRREADSRFTEIWFIGLWEARGDLREALKNERSTKKKIDLAVRFLCRHASFGTLDVVVQRAAMPNPD